MKWFRLLNFIANLSSWLFSSLSSSLSSGLKQSIGCKAWIRTRLVHHIYIYIYIFRRALLQAPFRGARRRAVPFFDPPNTCLTSCCRCSVKTDFRTGAWVLKIVVLRVFSQAWLKWVLTIVLRVFRQTCLHCEVGAYHRAACVQPSVLAQ